MKRFVLFLSLVLLCSCHIGKRHTCQVVVSDEGEFVGAFVATTANGYVASIQDTFSLPSEGYHLETWSAEKGQGVVYFPMEEGDDYLPECYKCLGVEGAYYRILMNGEEVLVAIRKTEWDCACFF